MPSAPFNQPLTKKRKFIGAILGLGLSIAYPPKKIVMPTPLRYTTRIDHKFRRLRHW